MASWSDVRRVALALPETTERLSRGRPSWSVRDKAFAWDRPLVRTDVEVRGNSVPDGPVLALYVAHLSVKQALISDDSGAFFTTPHFTGHRTVLVLLEIVVVEELDELMVEAWFCRAPKRLAKSYLG